MLACFGCSIREVHNCQEYMCIICTACTLSGMTYSHFASILNISKPLRLPLYFRFSKRLRLACTVLWYSSFVSY